MYCNTRTVFLAVGWKTAAIRTRGLASENPIGSTKRVQEKRLSFLSDLCLVFGLKP
ncbi:hypothetical protein ACTJKT_05305 [Pseudomonas sp. 22526]|jgi:hypothetical protein|uniref:hypothetical protein n=1 Tax=Pseudomonas TaxID=286 RepID=UPI000ACCB953|nr:MULTISPECIES: hypothetical protein [Pseudomonas]AZC39190.1 hypothetical protein C4K37_4821 [Pseudomonas chlororaphis subsp. piscium]AZC45741.1 hypothetical protein C4K36_4834 [Pseudomonas chlororaphis subsp. piscium]AZD03849.1 hypothetical protein C4K27_4673 [Pseudomonas chlororaphis subsp. chlororaphis]MBM0280944.1 hypothetical protein [Pseudomonas chlororaphis]MBP5077136.1 hypothetical protein [Pseudomonas chlororaphis]